MCKDDGDFDAERAYDSLKVCKRSAHCSLEFIQNYFLVMKHCFSLTIFQHKYRYKPNFSINELGADPLSSLQFVVPFTF